MSSDLVEVDALHRTAKHGLAKAWQTLWDGYAHEVIYGFGFSSNFAQYALPTAFTEAGLQTAVSTSDFTQEELRWSPGDSPRNLVGEEHLAETNEILKASREAAKALEESGEEPDEHDRSATIYDVLVAVLNELAAEGLFAEAPEVVLNAWGIEMGWEERRRFAHRCNPSELALRFSSEDDSWDAP